MNPPTGSPTKISGKSCIRFTTPKRRTRLSNKVQADDNWRGVMLDPETLNPQYVTDKNGEQTAVIIPIDAFRHLLEDIEDLAAIAERREEPTISHAEVIAQLKRDGLLPN